jgi:UDP-N-acetylmuramate--alanine ligase
MISPDLSLELPDTIRAAHFIGIGGSGMSAIAHMFLDAGIRVTGSDKAENPYLDRLRERGAVVTVGHDAANVGNADTVIFTSALWPENPEYLLAVERRLTVLHRSQALAWLARGRPVVSVAGAHGKTTSTGMIVTALKGLGVDPNFVNGGVISALGVSSASGSDDLFVLEADESDGSFLLYDTSVALITNVDADHLDQYGSQAAFERAFVSFAAGARDFVAISSDDAGAKRVTEALRTAGAAARIVTFGEAADADVRLHSVETDGPVKFTLTWQGRDYAGALQVPGHHNALNAAGAVAVLVGLGHDPQAALDALGDFGGTKRRFELKGVARGVRVYDDYAHNPTEAAAAVAAARTVVGSGRIIAVHQPHLYSRTKLMSGEFAKVYESLADYTVVLDVDGAREDPVPGVTGALVAEQFTDPSRVAYRPDWSEAAKEVARVAREGDLVMTLSCGDVYKIVPQLLDSLEATQA